MTDIAIIVATAKVGLQDIAKQANGLGTGLQNAAPGDKMGKGNDSIQYLLAIAEALHQFAEQCEKL